MPDGSIEITLPLTQQDLAGLVAGSRDAVAKILQLWRKQGLVTTARKRVVLIDPETLARRHGHRRPDRTPFCDAERVLQRAFCIAERRAGASGAQAGLDLVEDRDRAGVDPGLDRHVQRHEVADERQVDELGQRSVALGLDR